MKRVRVIPALLIQNGGLVKSVKFKDHKYVGDPINAVKIFNEKEVDEIIILDISATAKKPPHIQAIKEIASEAFMPLGYGGGITKLDEIKELISCGVEKVILNYSAVSNPQLINDGANYVGSQSIVVSIDVKKNIWGKYKVYTRNGTQNTNLDPVTFARQMESAGAGEIFLNSIDRDGTFTGYDISLIKLVASAVNIPVVASGGASSVDDFSLAIQSGASAVSAGSMFVFQGPHRAVLISYPKPKRIKRKVIFASYLIEERASMVFNREDPNYRQCTLTVMDNIADPDITFDKNGICNYYFEYKKAEAESVFKGDVGKEKLAELVERIKSEGKGKKYDCLIGLSGGVDSTYVAYLIKQLGLQPLAVHLDNGWDSELAVKNVENIITKLGFDLHTLVVNWEEFKDIQLAYLKASVVDIEVVSDHAIFATMYKLAKQYKISYIISGTNIVTEYIMPPGWLYKKMDFANLRDIHKQFGKVKIKTYPYLDFKRYLYYSVALRLNPVSILNYIPYNKAEVKKIITKELDWRDYGGKHYESLFTKFYQAYLLPEKFKIDKRKAHLSTLICSGQITREEALQELQLPLYQEKELKHDKEYVLKKLGLSEEAFDAILQTPPRRHEDFKTDTGLKKNYMSFLEKTKKLRKAFKS